MAGLLADDDYGRLFFLGAYSRLQEGGHVGGRLAPRYLLDALAEGENLLESDLFLRKKQAYSSSVTVSLRRDG